MTKTRRTALLLVTSTLVLAGLQLRAHGQTTPAPSGATPTAAPTAQPDSGPIRSVHVDRFVVATGVEAREPVGATESFPAGTSKVYAFVQLNNAKGAPYAVTVSWEKVGGAPVKNGVALNVPSAKQHRTWSWTSNVKKPGRYRAVLRAADGTEVASREFTIEG